VHDRPRNRLLSRIRDHCEGSLRCRLTNGNVIGGGRLVLTGPSFIDAGNVAAVAQYSARGTR
jgi:hypothetical protein